MCDTMRIMPVTPPVRRPHARAVALAHRIATLRDHGRDRATRRHPDATLPEFPVYPYGTQPSQSGKAAQKRAEDERSYLAGERRLMASLGDAKARQRARGEFNHGIDRER
jgi:hypothetical protein